MKGLEVVGAAYLSHDKVLCEEVISGFDFHEDNRVRFNLPDRRTAKFCKFRILYGGTEYGFSADPDFTHISSDPKFWKRVIDQYYSKYSGLHLWHTKIVQEATTTGKISIPTGRIFLFEPYKGNGGVKWPIASIKNYPVQALGADLVSLARVRSGALFRKKKLKSLLVSTVHDSIVADCPSEEVDEVAHILSQSIEEIPKMFEDLWKIPFDLPVTSEIETGMNLKDMEAYVLQNA